MGRNVREIPKALIRQWDVRKTNPWNVISPEWGPSQYAVKVG